MRILYDNITENATVLQVTSENVNYPCTNLQDDRMSRFFRSTSDTAQQIIFNSAGWVARYAVILSHNLSAAAVVTIMGNASNAWGDPDFTSDTMLVADDMILVFDADETHDWWCIEIDDPDNTNNYLQIGYVFIGDYLQMPGMKPAQELPKFTTAKSEISYGGQVYGSAGYEYRNFGVAFEFVTDAQRKLINAMFDSMRNYRPFILLPWAEDLTFEPLMYAVIDDTALKWTRNDSTNYQWKLQTRFREVW